MKMKQAIEKFAKENGITYNQALDQIQLAAKMLQIREETIKRHIAERAV